MKGHATATLLGLVIIGAMTACQPARGPAATAAAAAGPASAPDVPIGFPQFDWRIVDLGWETSCGVDRGSIERSGSTYAFRTSSNHCSGGIFNQRAEITSDDIAVSERSAFLFESTISFSSQSTEPFILFQVHDGRNGCSPPMSLRWRSDNTLSFDSDYTRGQGMAGCVENQGLRSARYLGPTLRRDGTPYELQVLLVFHGQGAFDIAVRLDGADVLSGRYEPTADPSFVTSSRFYMKHGVYSREVWPYEMRSEGMRLFRASPE